MMRNSIFLLAILFSFFGTLFAQSADDIQNDYINYLESRGYDPRVDGDGDVLFEEDNKTYFLEVNEDDPEFFRVVLANIWAIESAEENLRVLKACDYATSKTKVAKAYTVNDNVWITCELLVEDYRDYKILFDRALSVLNTATRNFVQKMRESQGEN